MAQISDAELQRLLETSERLERENEQWKRENDRLRREREKALRAAQRQAAPHSRGEPPADPQRPGRKPGAGYGRTYHRPAPDSVEEILEAALTRLLRTGPQQDGCSTTLLVPMLGTPHRECGNRIASDRFPPRVPAPALSPIYDGRPAAASRTTAAATRQTNTFFFRVSDLLPSPLVLLQKVTLALLAGE